MAFNIECSCMSSAADIRFAILGCGAVAEFLYLPVLERLRDARVTVLIDTNPKRRKHVASTFKVEHTYGDVDECYDLFDAAIVALPHALHAPAAVKLLAQRKAVLVEKPMALSVAECDAMIYAAQKKAGVPLAVGLMRRFIWSHRLTWSLIRSEALGRIDGFDFQEGFIYDWPVTSDFPFRKETAGGGVLVDMGAHVLDCLLHWLGDFSEVEYFDDAEGGVDANCLLKLRLQNGIGGIVELSRTRRLRNTAIIRGEHAALEISRDTNHLKVVVPGQPYVLDGSAVNPKEPEKGHGYAELFRRQLEDFIAAIRNSHQPYVDGQSAKLSIRLIETCYRHRKPLQLPWIGQGVDLNG
jgi:predicted dehydrogenase